jgi:hypothetical protein
VHGDASGEDDGGCSEESEKEEDGPNLRKVGAEGSPGRGESAPDTPVGLAIMSEMESEFYCVDLNEVEVETKYGRDQEDDDVADQDREECGAFDSVFVDVVGPFSLKEDERAEQKGRDEDGEEGDPEKTPEVDQALMEEGAESGGAFGLVAEESSGD